MVAGVKALSPRRAKVVAQKGPRGRAWCGPTALTVLTGLNYETCRRAIADTTGKRNVTAVEASALRVALSHLMPSGRLVMFRTYLNRNLYTRDGRMTLARFLRETRAEREASAFYLVALTRHYVVIRGRRLWDNHTPAEGLPLAAAPWRRAVVQTVFRLDPIDR